MDKFVFDAVLKDLEENEGEWEFSEYFLKRSSGVTIYVSMGWMYFEIAIHYNTNKIKLSILEKLKLKRSIEKLKLTKLKSKLGCTA